MFILITFSYIIDSIKNIESGVFLGILSRPLEQIPYVIITLLVAFTIHELAHAYVAYKFGDNTAAREGRLTFNPLKHLEPIGAIFILMFGFGWAKPVPVNRNNFKNPRLNSILVSVAGPISNFILALLGMLIVALLVATNIINMVPGFYASGLITFFNIFISMNIMLGVFNLLPLPPLDGYRIIEDLAPRQIRAKMASVEMYGFIIFLVLFVTPLGDYTIRPLMSAGMSFVWGILDSIINIFF